MEEGARHFPGPGVFREELSSGPVLFLHPAVVPWEPRSDFSRSLLRLVVPVEQLCSKALRRPAILRILHHTQGGEGQRNCQLTACGCHLGGPAQRGRGIPMPGSEETGSWL